MTGEQQAGGHTVTSEVGRLRTVLLHRPGPELSRLTPRNNADLLFDGLPWVARAQEEHDAFAQALRDRGVEVLHLDRLLVETLEHEQARAEVVDAAVAPSVVGPTLAATLRTWLLEQSSEDLAGILCAGLTHEELPHRGPEGVVARMAGIAEFVVRPLPNLLFTRDSSVWVRDHLAITSPSMHARQRETALTGAIYTHHPRFAGTPLLYGARPEEAWFEGGDVLLLAEGVVAVGVGQRTTPAGVEAAHGLVEAHARAPIAVGGEGDAPVGEREVGRPSRPGEPVRPRDLGTGQVGDRGAHRPGAEVGLEVAGSEAHPRTPVGDAEGQPRHLVAGVEAEAEGLLGDGGAISCGHGRPTTQHGVRHPHGRPPPRRCEPWVRRAARTPRRPTLW